MFLRHNILSISWLFFVVLISFTPGDEIPELSFELISFGFIVHFFIYFILTHSFLVGLNKQSYSSKLKKKSKYLVLFGVFIISILIEIIQVFIPGRFFDWNDVIANMIGIISGYIFFRILYINIIF